MAVTTAPIAAGRGSAEARAPYGRSAHVTPPASDAVAEALGTVWAAVHVQAAAVREVANTASPSKVIEAWCDCANAFNALAALADILDVDVPVSDELRRHAPVSACRR